MAKRKKKFSSIKNYFYLLISPFILIYYIFYYVFKILKKYKTARVFTALLTLSALLSTYFEYLKSKYSVITLSTDKFDKILFVIFIFSLFFFILKNIRKKYTIEQLDLMEGHAFEYACADILKINGFKNVEVTKGSGDYGVDILARKGVDYYAIQCKRYKNKLDNSPVQEVVSGKVHYNCNKAAVMTNSYLTDAAKLLAYENDVEIWDRDILANMASNPQPQFRILKFIVGCVKKIKLSKNKKRRL